MEAISQACILSVFYIILVSYRVFRPGRRDIPAAKLRRGTGKDGYDQRKSLYSATVFSGRRVIFIGWIIWNYTDDLRLICLILLTFRNGAGKKKQLKTSYPLDIAFTN